MSACLFAKYAYAMGQTTTKTAGSTDRSGDARYVQNDVRHEYRDGSDDGMIDSIFA